jgi:hypothetical protein
MKFLIAEEIGGKFAYHVAQCLRRHKVSRAATFGPYGQTAVFTTSAPNLVVNPTF